MRSAVIQYSLAAVAVVAALWLPRPGAELARQTGLGEAFVGSLFIAPRHDEAGAIAAVYVVAVALSYLLTG